MYNNSRDIGELKDRSLAPKFLYFDRNEARSRLLFLYEPLALIEKQNANK